MISSTFNKASAPNIRTRARRYSACLATVCWCFCTYALAERVDPPTQKAIALHDAIQRTLSNNPALTALGYQHAITAGGVKQASVTTRPMLNVTTENILGTGEYSGVDSAETTLSISWVMDESLKQYRVAAAQARAAVVNDDEALQRLDASAVTARYYLDVLASQTRLIHAEEAIRSTQDTLAVIRQRIDAGVASIADAARAETELARRRLEREDIEHRLLVAKHRLAAQWGASTPDFQRVEGNVLQLPKSEAFAQLKARVKQNPALATFASQQRVDESEIALAKAQTQPLWQFTAGIRHLAADNDQAVLAGFSLPLGTSANNQGRIAARQARIAQSEAARKAERLRIETALFALHQELNHSLHVAQAYRDDVIPRLQMAALETRRAYDMGRYSFLEWQTLQQELLAARSTVIDASVEAHLNHIEIERLTGVSATASAQP